MTDITARKDQHLDVILSGRARHGLDSGFADIRFVHEALPDLDHGKIDLGVDFLGRRLKAPLLISSMTGGPARAEAINARLAEAAQQLGIALAVGSQRAALESGGAPGLDMALRLKAPDTPILANIGAAQLTRGFGVDEARRVLDMIAADALIVHLNPLQEACQPEGDRDWWGVGAALEALVKALDAPVVVKETGAGLSAATARRLLAMGVAAVDVAGAGGSNWATVEGERSEGEADKAHAAAFADWGVPTARAIAEVRAACPKALIIGSGGIRDGVEAAKAIRLGADMVGQAAGVLAAATVSTEAVVEHFQTVIRQMRTVCFCTGSANLTALRKAPLQD
ncbi:MULTISPECIES: type 2 isopentenyl-diphosphate Delta-isomerase [unclassified Brevundimonas]|uniref:type 2 isopentenyl-diphosphate Delta-isomerase n=1 Tax=unclassified Brevundimonas TaxID=2622653 RepID=UPI0006F6E91E|nr:MULTISPECIES: type 2 isopentenyl-diphosphate Delta-isomerase [unclassified Brevundimonas]KQY86659.1 isopentenyl pyrophosphate isomerase [Brevundimonas sp. Root1423]KRA19389.1 isopentenyl pyrophosphate isomerase [Brevundimonas sp. Root608]